MYTYSICPHNFINFIRVNVYTSRVSTRYMFEKNQL